MTVFMLFTSSDRALPADVVIYNKVCECKKVEKERIYALTMPAKMFMSLGSSAIAIRSRSRRGSNFFSTLYTSKPASRMRGSISSLWVNAWFLMIATVLVGWPEAGLESIGTGTGTSAWDGAS